MNDYLLEKEDKIILDVFGFIERAREHEVAISDLLRENSLSKDRLLTILGSFEERLSGSELSNYLSVRIDKKTISVDFSDGYYTSRLLNFLMKRSYAFLLLDEIFSGEYISLEYFCEKYFCSLKLIRKRVERIRQLLQSYDLDFNLRYSEPVLGSEEQIRHFFFCMYWSIYQESEWPFRHIREEQIDGYIRKTCEKLPRITYSTILKGKLYLGLTAVRLKQRKFIRKENENFDIYSSPLLGEKIFNECFEQMMKRDFKVREKYIGYELQLLYFMFCCHNSYTLKECEMQNILFQLLSKSLNPMTMEWIRLAEEHFELQFSVQEYSYFLTNLYYLHCYVSVFHVNNSLIYHWIIEKEFQSFYPKSYSNVTNFFEKLRANKQFPFKEMLENNLYLVYQYALLLNEVLTIHQPKLRLLVLSQYSNIQQDSTKKYIKNHSSFAIEYVDGIEENPDAVLSDFPVDKIMGDEIPLFRISPVFSQSQSERLRDFFQRLTFEKRKKMSHRC
ncbi:MAG: helix-turn-helix domain-containing protein [Lactobacillales bacterium]|jgi:hypothetical protein|nr:helix-turn-helix domain-containing protein [Lactobacillales bacterium]